MVPDKQLTTVELITGATEVTKPKALDDAVFSQTSLNITAIPRIMVPRDDRTRQIFLGCANLKYFLQ
ncbi:MAG: hypothetical protein ABIO76_08080 [Ginsengibacter sp.]